MTDIAQATATVTITDERIELLARHLFRKYEGDSIPWENIDGWERVQWRNEAAENLGIGLGIEVKTPEVEGDHDAN